MEPNGPPRPVPPREQLTMAECLRLLASVQVGRIVYTTRALPAVDLVYFAVDGDDIVIRTDPDSALAAATHHTVVGFQADEVDTATGRGWSVMAVGRSREVTDPSDIARLRDIGPQPPASGGQDHFIRVTPGIVNGQRLAG